MGATATVKGGFFETNSVSSLTQISGKGFFKRRVAALLGIKQARAERELATTLNGVAAGSAASATNARVEANSELGGARTIETETLVSRNTTSADQTEINANLLAYSSKTHTTSQQANLDGDPLGEQR